MVQKVEPLSFQAIPDVWHLSVHSFAVMFQGKPYVFSENSNTLEIGKKNSNSSVSVFSGESVAPDKKAIILTWNRDKHSWEAMPN